MWLLSTKTGRLTYYSSVHKAPKYAILSHVWRLPEEGGEDSFQLVEAYAKKCDRKHLINRGTATPRDFLSDKVRRFLIGAAEAGLDFAWCDTCCIDKTSSAELSEAINSMFEYYARAHVCVAYLADVAPVKGREYYGDQIIDSSSARIPSSKWFHRGWTLQELLAPQVVVFLASDWSRIGTKCDLAEFRFMTSVLPASILRCEQDLSDISVSVRLSWASQRQTTRWEDQAYCLFGLFGINMPTLYGEGGNAFYRLQEEILRTHPDFSLFAWDYEREKPSTEYNKVCTTTTGAIVVLTPSLAI
ncbi:heterokaryon incompatibility protein-domain-containing protein [Epithele typhae]|uniref:heterokaryon incompatibility protein-domain-containing protein n=1 Tax=Epithele typhae TaxID=378194 RepID=UPI00200808B9|nr:heterokaryon incompatibility protein-domain-containing protein [Epithele typhae]KAH9910331.1 heterokaryon incompatibility protein-domain-containing protein [Epithele typhae]